eukprot:417481_1
MALQLPRDEQGQFISLPPVQPINVRSPLWIKIGVIVAILLSCGSFTISVYNTMVSIPNESHNTASTTHPTHAPTHPTHAPTHPTHAPTHPTQIPTLSPTYPQHYVGDYKLSANNVSHFKWLLCDGQYVKKDDYPQLYALIGNSFGENGETFALPNPQNAIIGISGGKHVFGTIIGEEATSFTLNVQQIPTHRHYIMNGGTCKFGAPGAYACQATIPSPPPMNLMEYLMTASETDATQFQTSAVGSNVPVTTNIMQPTHFITNLFIYAG